MANTKKTHRRVGEITAREREKLEEWQARLDAQTARNHQQPNNPPEIISEGQTNTRSIAEDITAIIRPRTNPIPLSRVAECLRIAIVSGSASSLMELSELYHSRRCPRRLVFHRYPKD
ncbi:uncharacterized protein [Venturia canescens]|uniref:uncharacterized protein n=1 Tax=Venturia canescens TaxID=32260 RepID=UPI001C9C6304|nr:uncharacterized protein LOC122416216 [Venturia canescens]